MQSSYSKRRSVLAERSKAQSGSNRVAVWPENRIGMRVRVVERVLRAPSGLVGSFPESAANRRNRSICPSRLDRPIPGDSGPIGLQSGCSLRRPSGLRRTRPRSTRLVTRLVIVTPTAHGAAHRTQYPKDQAEDDQDDTDCPKDGVTPKKGRDDQADDADGDQVCLR